MLESPFHYEEWLTPADFQKLGELALRWSHIDHIIGNCLKALLRFSDEEAVVMVFPLTTEKRLRILKRLLASMKLSDDAKAALAGLSEVMGHIQKIRNNTIHAILVDDPSRGSLFHLRSKERSYTKEQIFSVEELTNYAAHAALSLRFAIGITGEPGARHPLPDKPAIPDFLHNPSPSGIHKGPPLSPRLQPSRG